MKATHLPLPRGRRRVLWAFLAAGLTAAAGCAQIPPLGPAPAIKSVEQLQSVKSFDAPASAWPGDGWWKAYGDSQLDALIQEALRTSPDLAQARARLQRAAAAVQGASAASMPEVTGNAAISEDKQSYNFLMPRTAMPQGWNDYGRATANLVWELDFWGKNRAALAAAVSAQQAARAEVAQARLMLSTSVASAYAELLHLFEVSDSDEAALDIRAKTADLFRERYKHGLENLASVRQMEARKASAQAELLAIEEHIALQRNAIAALLGAGPDRGLTIARPTARFAGTVGLPPDLALDLIGRRPDIVAARLWVEAAAKRIDEKRAGFYPSVNLLGLVGFQSLGIDNLTKSGSEAGSIGAAVSLPIFNTKRLQGQLRGARAEYDAAVASYDGTLSNALREVADATTSRKALDEELAASRSAVDAAREASQLINQRYQGELATYLEVLSAQDALVSARRSLADLESRALVLDVALVRALGGGFQSGDNLSAASVAAK